MIKIIKELIAKYRELITYVISGALTTFVNWAAYGILVKYLKVGIMAGTAIAWAVSVIFAYVINKLWVFESKSFKPSVVTKEFLSFTSSRIITGAMEIFGVPFLVKIGLDQTILGIEGAWSKIIVSVVVIILNYVFSKLIVFRKKDDAH